MADIIEATFNVRIKHPFSRTFATQYFEALFDRISTRPLFSKTKRIAVTVCLPLLAQRLANIVLASHDPALWDTERSFSGPFDFGIKTRLNGLALYPERLSDEIARHFLVALCHVSPSTPDVLRLCSPLLV